MSAALRPLMGNTYLMFIAAALCQQTPAALVDVHSAVCQTETEQRCISGANLQASSGHRGAPTATSRLISSAFQSSSQLVVSQTCLKPIFALQTVSKLASLQYVWQHHTKSCCDVVDPYNLRTCIMSSLALVLVNNRRDCSPDRKQQ